MRRFVATTLADNDAVTRLIEGFATTFRAADPARRRARDRRRPRWLRAARRLIRGPPVKPPRQRPMSSCGAQPQCQSHARRRRAGAAVRDRRRARRAPAGRVHADHVAGTDALSAALTRRGWDVVIYGGEGEDPVPARKAKALVRMADPSCRSSPPCRRCDRATCRRTSRALSPTRSSRPTPARCPRCWSGSSSDARPDAHRLLLAQQAITDHVAAGLAPDDLCARALATLGETLGWTYGAVWRPEGDAEHAALHGGLARPRGRTRGRGVRRGLAPRHDRAGPRRARPRVRVPAARVGRPTSRPTATWRAGRTRCAPG